MYNYRTENDDLSVPFRFGPEHKNILWKVMAEELRYFNNMNSAMISMVRRNHEGFKGMNKKLRVVGEFCEHNIDIEKIDFKNLPKELLPVKDDISLLNQDQMKLLYLGQIDGYLFPKTKRNMAVELFRHYQEQSKAFTKVQGEYTFAPRFLENMEIDKKRHVQLHRKSVRTNLVKDKNGKVHTAIKIPYFKDEMIIKGDFIRHGWSIMLIHQSVDRAITPKSPWTVEFKKSKVDYLLRYIDDKSTKRSAFKIAKNDFRRTNL